MASLADRLKAFPLLSAASPEALRRVAEATHATTYGQGDFVWRAGDVSHCVFFLCRGLVEITRAMPDGSEVAFGLFGPRECPGLFASLDGKRYPAAGRVLSEDAELLRVDRTVLLQLSEQEPAVSRAMATVLRQHNSVLREKVDVVTAGEVPQRLATLFALLAERFGDETDGELRVPITLSRRVIARLVGARVETVIRVLSRWEKETFIETVSDGGFVVRDLARLEDEAHGAST